MFPGKLWIHLKVETINCQDISISQRSLLIGRSHLQTCHADDDTITLCVTATGRGSTGNRVEGGGGVWRTGEKLRTILL